MPAPPSLVERIQVWWDHQCSKCWQRRDGEWQRTCEPYREPFYQVRVNAQTGERFEGWVSPGGCEHRHHLDDLVIGIA